jgi:hypothetical protein
VAESWKNIRRDIYNFVFKGQKEKKESYGELRDTRTKTFGIDQRR